jgi:hypothetical protein
MAKLPTYTAEIGQAPTGGQRAQAQTNALGQVGRALSKSSDTLLTNMEDKESRSALIASSEIRAKYARELDAAALNGGDTEVLKEKMVDEMSRVGEQFETSRGASSLQLYSSNAELGFDEQANRIKITRAAAEAELEGSKFINAQSQMILLDPSYLKTAEQNATAFTATLRNVPPEKRALIEQGLKSQMNMTAAIGSARVLPEETKAKLEAGEWDLTPTQREHAIAKADERIAAKRSAENHARAVAEHERKQRDEKATHGYVNQIVQGTLTGRKLEDAITTDADLDSSSVRMLTLFAEHRAKELTAGANKSNPVTEREIFLRVYAQDTDPKKIINPQPILDAVAKGLLNAEDGAKYVNAVRNGKDENNRGINSTLYAMSNSFQKSLEQNYSNLGLKYAGQVPEVVNEFTSMATIEIEKARAANDPVALRKLFVPGNDTYVGGAAFMQEAINRVKTRHDEQIRAKMPRPTTTEEYNAIPANTPYIDSDGVPKVKGKAAPKAAPKAIDLAPAPDFTRGTPESRKGANEPLFPGR